MRDANEIKKELNDELYKMLKCTYDGTVEGMCDLIDKHIIKNHNAMVDYLTDDGDFEMALAHSGAITGLIMLKKELCEMHEDGE